ncbi:MAG: hypothetical protein RL885_26025 [Planctomycetota bacterium]
MSTRRRYCCDVLKASLADPAVPLSESLRFREIGIDIQDGGTSFLVIQYCPWCGTRLPDSLRDEWFDRLESMGIDTDLAFGIDPPIPPEFLTDDWYRGEAEDR